MKKRIYWKDIRLSIWQSMGRFLSIFSLMMIGAIALVGLKVTTPNMARTAQEFIDQQQMMDLAVMADYGLDEADVKELKQLPNSRVEFAYLTDVTIKGSTKAVRIFSQTEEISQFQLVSGRLPRTKKEIALAENLKRDYQIGEEILFSLGTDSPLKEKTYTVTGFVHSSEIWDPKNMGSSTAGTGQLMGYAMTTPQAFDSDVFMIARIKYQDLAKIPYHSSSYLKKLSQHQEELEKKLADNGAERLAVLTATAQQEISDGQEKIAQSEKELRDAEQKIQEGENQLEEGQGQLNSAKLDLEKNQNQLFSSRQDLSAAKSRLDTTRQSLAETKVQLDSNKAKLETRKGQLDAVANQLSTTKATLDAKNQELSAAAAQISSAQREVYLGKQALQEKINNLQFEGKDPYSIPEIQATQASLNEQEASIATAMQTYEAGFAQYQEGFSQYQTQSSQYQAALEEYEAGYASYQAGVAQYEAGVTQYEAGLAQYQKGLAQYEAGQSRLQGAQSELSQKEQELAQAQKELDSSKNAYEDGEEKAQDQIQAAKEDLAEAKEDIQSLREPTYHVYNRPSLPGGGGYENYRMATNSISAVGNIFPVVLYLVAALVTFTTMTRYVDEERHHLGIFGALGYTKRQIVTKFVLYGLVASFLGTLVGILAGNFILSPMISRIITKSTVIGQANLYFYPSWILLAFGLALLSAVLPTYLVARKELNQEPSQLLLGKPPVSGSTIVLEKISFIWKRLSFTHKVTARNIFRYKLRMFMTIFGVAGSVALLFAGLGIQSSVSGVADTQFHDLIAYDMMVVEKEGIRPSESKNLADALHSQDIAQSAVVQLESLTEKVAGQAEPVHLTLMVAEEKELSHFIHLRKRGGDSISLGKQGVVITEKLAKLYGVKTGDTFSLHLKDQILPVRVDGITEMYTGHFVYISSDYYQTVTGNKSQPNAYLIALKNNQEKQIQKVAAQFLKMDGVAGVVQNTALVALINSIANSLQSVMVILTVLSVLLAVVILFNLTTINVAERIRELSTIRVLGFHNKEVTLYIYRETILLAIIGIFLGLGMGYSLHKVILGMIGSSETMFNPTVAPYVYLTPIVAIVSILILLGFLVNHKLRQLDMLEALKSGE